MEELILPPLYCPFPSAINRHADTVQQRTIMWVCHFELVTGETTLKRFCASKFGWLAARAYPTAALEELQIVSDWNTWLFMLDDRCDESGIGKQPDRLTALFARFLSILKGEKATDRDGPLGKSLYDLWKRMERKATAEWMERFIRSAEEYFAACLWEATNRAKGITPDVATYVKMRPLTGGLNTDVDLIDITEGIDLPLHVREHADIRRLTLMANNVVCWSNDIISLDKEMKRGDVHNLVLALRCEHQLVLQQAIDHAAELHDAEVRAFIDLEPCLPSFGAAVDADLERYVAVLRSWMRGNLDWSHASGRYRPAKPVLVG